jgi:hypothetical protein
MDTYKDIVEEVAENVGWQISVEKNLNKILKAVWWAELQILGKSRGVKYMEKITLKSDIDTYALPEDYNSACKVIITDNADNRYLSKEIEFGELTAYAPSPDEVEGVAEDMSINPDLIKYSQQQTSQDAMYKDYVVFAFQHDEYGYKIKLNPSVDGYLYIYYAAITVLPDDIDNQKPTMLKRFWFGIVAGATHYLLRRMVIEEKDANKAITLIRSSSEYKGELQDVITDFSELQAERSEPPIVKPFEYYEVPEDNLL